MGKKIVDYRIVFGEHPDAIATNIKKLLLDGWQPFGSVFVERFSGYYQAMVKYEKGSSVVP